MKTFNFIIASKNHYSVLIFCLCLHKMQNSNIKKIKMSILKSPNVNKTSQEQFELKFVRYKINTYFLQSFKHIVFIKKLYYQLISNVNVKCEHISSRKTFKYIGLYLFNLNNLIRLNHFLFAKNLNKNSISLQKSINYQDLVKQNNSDTKSLLIGMSLYGEFCTCEV